MSLKVTADKVSATIKSINAIARAKVLVGIPANESARSDDPIGNAGIGYIQEFGSPAQNIPARPFLIPGVKAVQDDCVQMLEEAAKEVLDDGKMTAALTKAGIIASNSVKATITKGEGFAPLAESTLKARQRKGFKGTKPLIRTGQLRNSITYIVKGA